LGDFLALISPPTLRFDGRSWYRIEEHGVLNNLGQVSGQEVAEFVRKWQALSNSRREKENATSEERERNI
jgi:hypothetical protein